LEVELLEPSVLREGARDKVGLAHATEAEKASLAVLEPILGRLAQGRAFGEEVHVLLEPRKLVVAVVAGLVPELAQEEQWRVAEGVEVRLVGTDLVLAIGADG
jgi:hypothetical protein